VFRRKHKPGRRRGAVSTRRPPVPGAVSRRGLVTLVLMLALGWGGWQMQAAWQQTVVPVAQVDIAGELRYLSEEQLRRSIRASLVGGYFSIDLNAVRQALLQLPWVEEVSVRRKWPSGLSIRVQEKTAVAYWNEHALLSARGEVFRPQVIAPDMGLPALAGPDGMQQTVWQFMQQLQTAFAGLGLPVARLVLDRRRAWQIHLAAGERSDGVLIRLGRKQTQQRLQRFIDVFAMPNAPSLQQVASVDMRYPNGFAMMNSKPESSRNREDNSNARESEV